MQKLLRYIRLQTQKNGKFRPVIISDIDGVLLRGSKPIDGCRQALIKLRQSNIPIACLTNGAGQLEKNKANKMNQYFSENFFSEQYMFMAHTPLKPILKDFSNKEGIVLVTGCNKVEEVIQDLQISNYITADQFYALYHPQINEPQTQHEKYYFKSRNMKKQDTQIKVKQRFGTRSIPGDYQQWCKQINSIFAINDVSPYETALQVIHNVMSHKKRLKMPLPTYYAAQNDLVWAGGYHRPRLAFGPFNFLLEEHFERHHYDFQKIYYGKPFKHVFQFVEQKMSSKFEGSCFFMIGDNPRADICGANNIGWASFLTLTGIHPGPQNDKQNPATFVVNSFSEVVDILLKIQKQCLYK